MQNNTWPVMCWECEKEFSEQGQLQIHRGTACGKIGPSEPPTEAMIYDDGKPRLDLIPQEALFEVARVYTVGIKKYQKHQWRKGADWGRRIAAAQRHIGKWLMGESIDKETGTNHLANAIASLEMVLTWELTKSGKDDRWRP